jgi:DNA modification methylase
VLIWDKGPAFGMGDLSMPWKPSYEEIYVLGRGFVGKRDEGVIKGKTGISWESQGRCHPNEKPAELMCYLIRKTPGEVILDSFMGGGSTGVACIKLDRKFIGIEKDPKYFEVARERIEIEWCAKRGRTVKPKGPEGGLVF